MKYTNKRKIYIALSAAALIAVMAIIFHLSHQTAKESSETSDSLIAWIYGMLGVFFSQDVIRTLAHLCEFAGLGFLTSNLIFSFTDKIKPFLSILFSWLYALTDEIHQIFVDGRAFQISDLAVDLGGVTLGTAVFALLIFFIKTVNSKKNSRSYKNNEN